MKRMHQDVIVAGLGAMGSAAAWHLAERGQRVLGLDRFAPPHSLGSSHGSSRVIRQAYFEHPLYVPLVRRAYECWRELEQRSGRTLLRRTGGVMIGPPAGIVVGGARASAIEHGLEFEEITAGELRRRFPGFEPPAEVVGIWEPDAGILDPETAIEAQLELARRSGAELRRNEPVLSWKEWPGGVEVTTPRGTYAADQLVIAAGPWLRRLVPDLEVPLEVERVVVFWFLPARATDLFSPERFPIFIWEHAPGLAWYGFPDTGAGVKVGLHYQGEAADPETVERAVAPGEVERVRALLREWMPAADGPVRDASVCMYTNTPDRHFLIDRHPGHPRVLMASPCSGHGFKFASAIGEVVADLVERGESRFDLAPFRLARFAAPAV